ncbi:MAG: hypothetical protein IFNCLDLE_02585 [Ignavibacteriaceae bacterium]|nr:hypothetical protein [Ignavibacteriaceae bacterium]MBZ0198170.1 cell surface protein SprA [Ignavibacteriaceae bacterium]
MKDGGGVYTPVRYFPDFSAGKFNSQHNSKYGKQTGKEEHSPSEKKGGVKPKVNPFPFSIPLDMMLGDFGVQDTIDHPSDSTANQTDSSEVSATLPADFNAVQTETAPESTEAPYAFSDETSLKPGELPASASAAPDSIPPKDSSITDSTLAAVKDSALAALKDTIATDSTLQDTVKLDPMAIDSTARLNYFKVKREDVPYSKFQTEKKSSFFANPTNYKRVVEIDSTGGFVNIKEFIGNMPYKYTLRLPFDQYLKMAMDNKNAGMWQDLGYKYELKETKKGLSDFLKDITDFEIPLPSVGVLSIFGPPVISLRIGGAVDIHAAWRNESTEGITASLLGNTRNEPDFKQQVQINVSGTIGDKLNINADWNTERNFEYENQLKIKYTGYEDEIVQSVEAGNVSLQTSGLVGGSEALFGVKANFKMGPFTLTALVSQKKAEVKEKDLGGGTVSQDFTKRAYDYSTNHFFLDTLYADTSAALNLFYRYYANPTPEIVQEFFVKDIEVWKSINQTLKDPNERSANAYISLPPIGQGQSYPDSYRALDVEEVPGQVVKGRFIKLTDGVDYIVHRETGYISFKTNVQDQDIIAVAYRTEGVNTASSADDLFYGEFLDQSKGQADTTQRLVLKLVKPQFLQPTLSTAWKLMLKNIYAMGGRNVKEDGFEFDLKYEVDGGEPQPVLGSVRLLNAFGLDLVGPNKMPPPDGKFDFKPGITILVETGEVIFPTLQPFGRNLSSGIPNADSLKYMAIYDQTLTFAKQDKLKDKWVLTGKFSGEASSTYQLGFNVVENSVKVYLDGRLLSLGTDYVVDYNIGQVTIRNSAALSPGAKLRITYEENDLFQLASKTLFGARGILDISKKTKLGFSALTLSQQTLSDKVRIGEEPLSNFILGLDFQTSHDLPFLTNLIDNVLSTKEMSSISFTGEAAYMNPDPNTKKSTIESDGGKSIAYIDDFEGAKRTIPIGITYGAWKDLSAPDSLPSLSGLTRQQRMNYKGKAWWFNVLPSDVKIADIWPNRSAIRGEDFVTVLDFAFKPDGIGPYNYTPNLSDPRKAWGGMMKVLSSTANNLVDENIEFIEFWMNIRTSTPDAKIYIDLGKISEDVIPNNKLDSEDKAPQNELIDEGEDTGLDGLFDPEERAVFGSTEADPSHDNFGLVNSSTFDIFNFYNINGTEGNAQLTDIGRIPDTEDLNRNGVLDQVNSYFRYEIPIDTSAERNPFIKGGGNNAGWYLVRVPLKDYQKEVGKPSFTLVEFIRFFVTDADGLVSIRLADFNLVGNQWRKAIDNDTLLSVSVVNIEDNPDYFSPGGVARERDRSRPDQEIYRNEQSLDLIINGLPPQVSREAVKYLFRPLDVFNYSEMKLFIHGDSLSTPGSITYEYEPGKYSSEFFFRFGTDTNNYYEYRQPVLSGWQEISILFSQLTAIKQARDSVNTIYRQPVEGKPGHFYVVKGNATLTSVKFLSVGIRNTYPFADLHGEIWVNELRVVGADNTPGWAYTASASLKFADILTVNANISQTDPYFHRLADRFGSRVQNKNWGVSADLDILKLLPVPLPGSNLRVNYSRTESVGDPLYLPGTDIKVSEAARIQKEKMISEGVDQVEADKTAEQIVDDSRTVNISDTWTVANVQIKVPSDFWVIRDILNNLTYNFNYNSSFSRNPTTLSSKNWQWNASINYGLTFSPNNFFEPGKIPILGEPIAIFTDYKDARIYYSPQNLTWNISARRSYALTQTRAMGQALSQETISRDFTANRGFNFNWKVTEKALINLTIAYQTDFASSLSYLETDEFNNARPESMIWSDIFSGQFFGHDFRYNQSLDIKTSPRLPSIGRINEFFQLTAGYNVKYGWNNDFQQPQVGRSAGFQNRTNLGLRLRLKALTAPWFEESPTAAKPAAQPEAPKPRSRPRDFDEEGDKKEGGDGSEKPNEEPSVVVQDTVPAVDKPSVLRNIWGLLKNAVRILIFDYDNITMDYSNDVNVTGNGIRGFGNGFKNFWGLNQSNDEGPDRLFILGLNHDIGPRAANANLTNNYAEKNNLDIRTSKPLWEGAKIDLSWKVSWSINKSTTLQSDENGSLFVQNISSTGNTTRSFFTMPPVLFLSIFKSGIKRVNELYDRNDEDPAGNLSSAFVKGFESMPLLGSLGALGDFINYIPRPNWRFSWDGLEKLGLFQGFAKKVSIDHSYSSEYTEGWKITPDGDKVVQTQRINYNFAPLLGLNITFNNLWGGNFSGRVQFNTRTSYDLGTSTKNITENLNRDIGITLNYSKAGFEIPLFGLALKNDIEFSLSYTNTKNSTVQYDMERFTEEGIPQNGTTTTTIEPRIKYVISSRVTVSLFYKRSDTTPEGAARIPPTTRNEAGLDIKISIQ